MQEKSSEKPGGKTLPTLIYRHIRKYCLIYLGAIIYLLFYISVARTGWFDIFFSSAALHVGAKGIDFYQLPKGAWAFWHNGSLSGKLSSGSLYASQYFSNGNVYHPLFTLTFGSFLTLFEAAQSPYAWLWTKLLLSLVVIAYFFWSFRTSKYICFAVFILFANFSIYLELAAWQFQFILNILLLLLLIGVVKRRSAFWNGIIYWAGLLIKPVGLLLAPAFLCKGRWKVVAIGVWFFFLSTVIFIPGGVGQYYTQNLLMNLSSSGTLGPNQIITFSALLHYTTHWPDFIYQIIQDGFLLAILFLSILRRTHIAKTAFLAVVYYLCFYEGVYEYQWSTLAYILAICIVTCPEFQTRLARICILLTCLPGCFVLLNLLHIDIQNQGYLGLIPGATAWEWMVASKVLPLALLLISVIASDIKPTFRQIKAFWSAVRKVNEHLEMFGDKREEAPEQAQESAEVWPHAHSLFAETTEH